MDDDDADYTILDIVEDSGVVIAAREADFVHEGADLSIPLEASLFEAVKRLFEPPDEVFLVGGFKTRWLAHIDGLVEVAVEVSILEINLMYFPVVGSGEGENKTERGHTNGQRGSFVEVDARDL